MSKDIIPERLKNIIIDYVRWLLKLGNFEGGGAIREALDDNDLDMLLTAINNSKGNPYQDEISKIATNSIIFSIRACNLLHQLREKLLSEGFWNDD